jgi:hypothetical protein
MKRFFLISGMGFILSLTTSNAGTVTLITDGSQVTGKLTLNPSAVHVDGSSPTDVNLPDILEADFSEAPFLFNYYAAIPGDGDKLPPDWKAGDIGQADTPGKLVYANGTFSLTASGSAVDRKEDTDFFFFAGAPWTGNGQWTARVREMDPAGQNAEGGLMIRDSLDPGSVMFGLGAFDMPSSKGLFHSRNTAGEHRAWSGDFPIDFPAWLRLTKIGSGIDGSYSTDGKTWSTIAHYDTKVSSTPLVGLFANSRSDKPTTVMIDNVTFTTTPSLSQMLPPGLMLKSGSFIVGSIQHLDFDPTHPDAPGIFTRSGKNVTVMPSQIGAIVMMPLTRSQLAGAGAQVGIMTKSGDFLEGQFQSIDGGGAKLTSQLMGASSYAPAQIGACVLHAVEPQPADYEIRLTDGSIIEANSFGINNGKLGIGEISGINIDVDPEEIAQLRAGSAHVQDLFELPWKATPPPPAAPAAAATPPVTNAAPAANPAPTPPTTAPAAVQVWNGNGQEQVMVAPAGARVDFPLTDKFRALALKIALSPNSPPHSQMLLHILVNGREAASTPPFRAGDQPRFLELTLQNPKTISFVVESPFPGVSALIIDPVAIRESSP